MTQYKGMAIPNYPSTQHTAIIVAPLSGAQREVIRRDIQAQFPKLAVAVRSDDGIAVFCDNPHIRHELTREAHRQLRLVGFRWA